jgi:hypothetical protein
VEGKTVLARKFRIPKRKIQIRGFLRHFAESQAYEVDLFREHVHSAAASERRSIDRRAAELPEEAQEFLSEEVDILKSIAGLADQLAIVVLYRVVELNTGRILRHKFGTTVAGKTFSIDRVGEILKKQLGIKIESVPHYRAIDELRLLNNCIKHEGRVSKQLADRYSRWKQGVELTDLGAAYERLRPKVPAYIFRLAQRVKLRFN